MSLRKWWDWFTTNKTAKHSKSTSSKQKVHQLYHATSTKLLSNKVLLFILINSILGSSIFYLPSLGVQGSGSLSLIAWPAIFIIACFIMLYIAELTEKYPSSGGTYTFTKHAYGRTISFFAGWLIWIAGNLGMALNLVAAAQYFIPQYFANAYLLQVLFSFVWIIALNYMAYRSIDAGATMLVVFGIFSVVVISAMTIPSFIDVPALSQGILQSPFTLRLAMPFVRYEGSAAILTHFLLTLLLISEAFFGFETLTYMANEAKDKKSLHKQFMWAMLICGTIMTVYIFSSLGTIPYGEYVTHLKPWAKQAYYTLGSTGEWVITFGMYLVIIGAAAAWPITSSRLLHAMAKDKLFPQYFARLHPEHKSPHRAVIFQTVCISLFTWFIFRGYLVRWGDPYRTGYLTYVTLSIILISLIVFCVPKLRNKKGIEDKGFKAPFPIAGPSLIVLFFAVLLFNWIKLEGSLALSIIEIAVLLIIIAIPLYLLVEAYYDPRAIKGDSFISASFASIVEPLFFSLTLKQQVLTKVMKISHASSRKQHIVEFDCASAELSKRIKDQYQNPLKITAIATTKQSQHLAKKRLSGYKNTSVVLQENLTMFKQTQPPFNILVSCGSLSKLLQVKKTFTRFAASASPNATLIMIDYFKYFYILSNLSWFESQSVLIELLRSAGWDATIEIRHSILGSYIVVEAKKR